jgi:colanic acid biosynthesis glycosyl transferase WcaI
LKIHLITNLFSPDELAGAALFTDLALFLKEHGHDVRVTCTFSYYPAWKLNPEDQGVSLREEVFQGIPIKRVKMFIPSSPKGASRMVSDASFFLSLLRHGRFPNWIPDLVVTASPMFSQCLVQRFLYLGKRIPRFIIVQDFVVDAALELGILKFPFLSSILKCLEKWSFRSASTLSTISEEMLVKLKAKVGNDRKTLFIPNWIHSNLKLEIENQKNTVVDRKSKLLFYSGNIGVKQGLPDFLQHFQKLDLEWDLKIHGGGAEIRRLREVAAQNAHIFLGDVLSGEAYVTALREASACLITQKSGVGANFLPSKVLPALATGTPVLAICESNTPLAKEVRRGNFGEVVDPADFSQLKAVLERWTRSPELLTDFGRNAMVHASFFQREQILKLYEAEFDQLISGSSKIA